MNAFEFLKLSVIIVQFNRVLGMGNYVKSAAGLPLLDPITKQKPEGLSRDYGDMCLAADGFAQVMCVVTKPFCGVIH